MSTARPVRTARTIAATVALGLTGVGLAVPATAATAPKALAIKASQYPRLIDRPGSDNDSIQFTNVPGIDWKLNGTSVAFTGGKSVADSPVTAASTVTFAAVTGDPKYTFTVPAGLPSQWTFPAPSSTPAPPVDVSTISATWNDVPGKRDSVTLTNVKGVVWTVTTGSTTATYDSASFGTKTDRVVPAVPGSTAVTVAPDAGYTLSETAPTFTNTLTEADTVILPATLDDRVSVGDNPADAHKGYGPGAAYETVKIEGLPGVVWKIGSSTKKVTVKGTAYLRVDPDDLVANKVKVEALALKGYQLPDGYAPKDVDFTDGAMAAKVVKNEDIKESDLAGTAKDTLKLTSDRSFTWWVGQPVKQRDGSEKIVYKAVKADKTGVATYKPRFTKGEATAKVFVKPVANRGFTVGTSELTKTEYAFTSDARDIARVNQGVVSGTTATFTPAEGVVSWSAKYSTTSGTRTSNKTLAIKATDITNTGATSMTVDFGTGATPVVTTKIERDYRLIQPTP